MKVGIGPQPDARPKTMTPEMDEDLASFEDWLGGYLKKGWRYVVKSFYYDVVAYGAVRAWVVTSRKAGGT